MPAPGIANRPRFSSDLCTLAGRLGPGLLLSMAIDYAQAMVATHPDLGMSEAEIIDEIVRQALNENRSEPG